jgi:hypothetical protein
MQHQKSCNRSAAHAALDFAIPAPLTPDLGGGIRSPFNAHPIAQPSLADGSPLQVCCIGLHSPAAALWLANTGLSQFAVVPQFGIAFPGQSLAGRVPRRRDFLNPARSANGFRQAHSRILKLLPALQTARQHYSLASEPRLHGAGFNLNFGEQFLRRWAHSRASPLTQQHKQRGAP